MLYVHTGVLAEFLSNAKYISFEKRLRQHIDI